MWMMVLFDLPVLTKKERKDATKFRKFLLDQGFDMCQLSVYLRFCAGKEQAEAYTKRVESALPPSGNVQIIYFTDKAVRKQRELQRSEAEARQQKSAAVHAVLRAAGSVFCGSPPDPPALIQLWAGRTEYYSRREIGGPTATTSVHEPSSQKFIAEGRSGANRNTSR